MSPLWVLMAWSMKSAVSLPKGLNGQVSCVLEWGGAAWVPVLDSGPGVFRRSSAQAYLDRTGLDYVKEYFNSGVTPDVSDTMIGVDDYVASHQLGRVDFLKSDTDGHELGVLRSARVTLGSILAVYVETSFDAPPDEDANSFATISTTLGEAGLRLFDLELWRYSRAAFPMPFLYDAPAQTVSGQVFSGDGLFCRDLIQQDDIDVVDALKLIAIFDWFGLQDCAVELLVDHRVCEKLDAPFVDELLTALGSRSVLGESPTATKRRFRENPASFLPAQAKLLGEASEASPLDTGAPSVGIDDRVGPEDVRFPEVLAQGWHDIEPCGAWSLGTMASISFSATAPLSATERIELGLSVPGANSVDGQAVVVARVRGGGSAERIHVSGWGNTYSIPVDRAVVAGETVVIQLEVSPLVVPSIEGWSEDSRALGVCLTEVRVCTSK